ncbi:hypothetical protein N7G274_006889 [Stereocaulon virgatum]|uniref:Uncharacterized protein n=1 Tax=Stereocaulon virgatum TaxID=373712 RepID=A0ABR4A6B4_9LECA
MPTGTPMPTAVLPSVESPDEGLSVLAGLVDVDVHDCSVDDVEGAAEVNGYPLLLSEVCIIGKFWDAALVVEPGSPQP